MNKKVYSNFLIVYATKHILRHVFIISGVALGIALFFSTSWNGMRAERSLIDFSLGFVDDDFQVKITTNKTVFSEQLMQEIFDSESLRSIRKISPQLRKNALIYKDSGENLRLPIIGIDLFEDGLFTGKPPIETANSSQTSTLPEIYFSKGLMDILGSRDKYQILIGDKKLEYLRSEVGIIHRDGGIFLVQDLPDLQRNLGLTQMITSIHLYYPEELYSYNAEIQKITSNYEDLKLETRQDILSRAQGALRSFRMNLVVVSLISVLISLFMVSQNLSGLYFQRKKELAIYRSLGASFWMTFRLFLSQSLLIGIPGTLIGIWIGINFTELLSISETTVTDSKQVISYANIPWDLVFISLFIGIFGSFIAGMIPAIRAGFIPPAGIIREGDSQKIPNQYYKWFMWVGIISILPGYVFAFGFSKILFIGFISIGIIILGQIFLFPPLFRYISSIIPVYWATIRIGIEEIKERPLGNTFSAATLMLSISLVFTLTTLTRSYKTSLIHWVESENPFDFSIVNSFHLDNGLTGGVSADILNQLRNLESISHIDPFVIVTNLEVGNKMYTLHALPLPESNQTNSIYISKNLGYLDQYKIGDKMTLSTPKFGDIQFTITGEREHFFSERGTIIMDLDVYDKFFGIQSFNSIRLSKQKNTDTNLFRKKIEEIISGDPQLILLDSDGLKNIYLSGLDKVFGTLDSLKWTAVFISILSLLSAVLHGLFDKLRLYGVLSILGASSRQIFQVMFFSASTLTLLGGFIGVLSSLSLSPLVLYVINRNAFGWVLEFDFPWFWIIYLFPILIFLAFFATLLPFFKLKSLATRELLNEE
ncbi:ABC transporter permease [Leptospira sp. GIMC2001]|uniref:ABC transporter permease n=1 Tax=Leptospira sp. GIMC2001 TaxID=1513297 RepID=UPI00234A5ADC|nr:ABC transporter permease [Leptospira sp. GIMC2001]WCL48846.1 FtsX-like permease family protein [Leptospira sp. GIMC2001]